MSDKSSRITKQDALNYHSMGRKGKIEVVPTKAVATARDLSLAYSPGVADPCLEIEKDEEMSYEYTARGNLVAVLSNGTAVLGLGDIGAAAGKPVMEGKGVLFKRFADIDVFDIEVNEKDVDKFCEIAKALEPTFGGINLEDISAPTCFAIEERLKEEMNIPVFHDDQHGTAIISGAALLNALELTGKKAKDVTVVVSGAGASALACTKFYVSLGVDKKNVILVDSRGVVYDGRGAGINKYKEEFMIKDNGMRTLADAVKGADIFLGASVAGLLSQDMVKSMAKNPIVFAMANPDPEISYPDAVAARDDVIMATGRSDYPNQVNNVLGFPFIFRGALDVRATTINEEMKRAAAHALADLAREEVPESVSRAYGNEKFKFGREYIIPKPFDPRVLLWVAPAIAKAAIDSGVARIKLDIDEYRNSLKERVSRPHAVMGTIFNKAKVKETRIAFPESDDPRILQAVDILNREGICKPVLVGKEEAIRTAAKDVGVDLEDIEIIDFSQRDNVGDYIEKFYEIRQRRGMLRRNAEWDMKFSRNYQSAMMLRLGEIDGVVTGVTRHYADAVRPYFQLIGTREGIKHASGSYILVFKNNVKIIADATVNVDPTADELADIANHTAELARYFDIEPRVAMLSYSNFGTTSGASPAKMREATRIAQERYPEMHVDGEMQVDAAVMPNMRGRAFPFSKLEGEANVLVFPNLDSANMGYKLLWRLGGAEVIGPILMGMDKPVNILQIDSEVDSIVNLAAVTALRAQEETFPV